VPLFEAVGLHKRFGDRVVLEHIDLAFEAGSLTGIMGPNGAGKTTCFNCLTGMYAPDRGEIRMDGRSIAGRRPDEVTRLGVAYFAGGSHSCIVSRWSARKPGSTCWRFHRLLTSNAAPITSISDNAIWTASSAAPARVWPGACDATRSAFVRLVCQAGAIPSAIAVTTVTAEVNTSARPSTVIDGGPAI